MRSVVVPAYAKINLNLSVGEKRWDGYHPIDSVMHSITLSDMVVVTEASHLSLSVTEGEAPEGEENLMWKAALLFADAAEIRPDFHLELMKRIPSGAGMGGGSADAAAVLLGLNRLCDNRFSMNTLCALASSLGADVPFCLMGGAARCENIGNAMTGVTPWEGLSLVIVKPEISISTAIAYGEIDYRKEKPEDTTEEVIKALELRDLRKLGRALANDFENVLFPLIPGLRETSDFLKTFERPYAMTGSGAAFFLIAGSEEEAGEIAAETASVYPECYVTTVYTRG